MFVRSSTLACLIVLAASYTASAQVRPNAVSLELAGPGGAYSVGYERALTPTVRAQVGVSYIGVSTIVPVAVYATPLVGRVGGHEVRADLGVGVVVGATDGPSLYTGSGAAEDGETDVYVLPTTSVGARAEIGRFDLRAGVNALYGVYRVSTENESELFFVPRLSGGYRF